MASKGNLRSLNDRLNSIDIPRSTTEGLDSNSPEIKIEEGIIDANMNKYICAECGHSARRISHLAHHYTLLHTRAGFVCPIPDCGIPFGKQQLLSQHCNKQHGRRASCPYPGCVKQYSTWLKLYSHIATHSPEAAQRGYYPCLYTRCKERFPDATRLTEHAYQAHPGISVASGCLECQKRFPTDQELCGHYRSAHPFPGTVTLKCPASGCSASFLSRNDLYRHYRNSRHPSYIPNQVPRHLAFKCPFTFCARAYSSEIGLGIHNALAHGSEIGGMRVAAIPSANLAIERVSNSPESSTDQLASERQFDNSIERTPRDSVDNVIEVDEQGAILLQLIRNELLNHLESDETEFDETEFDETEFDETEFDETEFDETEFDDTADPSSPMQSPPSQKQRIGFILESHLSSNEPEEAARVGHAPGSQSDHSHDDTDFPNEALAREILQRVLHLLQVNDNLSVDELLELWTVFLWPDQRKYVIKQLKKLNIQEPSDTLIARIRGSALAAVIFAWIRFKALLEQTPLQLQNAVGRRPCSSGRDTAWAILMHCMLLEDLRGRALPTALSLGLARIPDRLRFPSQGYDLSGPTATLAQILDALAERAKCRKVHSEWTQLTNAMVLTEVPKYVAELKEVVLALYPGPHDSQEWFQVFGTG